MDMDEKDLDNVNGGNGDKNDKLKEYPHLRLDPDIYKYGLAYGGPPYIPEKVKEILKKFKKKDKQNDEEK